MSKSRKKKYTDRVSCGITGTAKVVLKQIKRETGKSYAALIREAIGEKYNAT